MAPIGVLDSLGQERERFLPPGSWVLRSGASGPMAMGNRGTSQVPGMPLACLCPALVWRAAGPLRPTFSRRFGAAPVPNTTKAPATKQFRGSITRR